MFRLINYYCVNSAGFRSGLGLKKVSLDLSTPERLARNVFVISGNNATGKSVLSESLHPFTTNTGAGRQRFFIDGKEGLILRDYLDDDGTEINTKMVYSPRSGGGHNTKCFFAIRKPGEEEATELNPTGNVTSYLELVKTYLGITKDFVSFASYSEAVKGLVTETSYERKNKISALIPNTNRFEVAYSTINDKYKTTRTLARNVAQKMIHLRDEDSIRGDLNRCEKEISETMGHRERTIKQIAEYKGHIKALAGDEDVDKLIDRYQDRHSTILNLASSATRIRNRLESVCAKYGISPTDSELNEFFEHAQIRKNKLDRATTDLDSCTSELLDLNSQMNDVENELYDTSAMLHSLDNQNTEELEENLRALKAKLDDMEYAKDPSKYSGMNYAEIMSFIDTVDTIRTMVERLYGKYGQIFNDYFARDPWKEPEDFVGKIQKLRNDAEQIESQMNTLHSMNAGLYQYQRLQNILDQRPKDCHIDTCPFIQDALKWPQMEAKIAENDAQYDKLMSQYTSLENDIKDLELKYSFEGDITALLTLCGKNAPLFEKYLNIPVQKLYASFTTSVSLEELNLDYLKHLGAILSEKELYERIVRVDIPEMESMIKLSHNADANRKAIQKQVDGLEKLKNKLRKRIDRVKMNVRIDELTIRQHEGYLEASEEIREIYDEVVNAADKYDKLKTEYESLGETVEKIIEMMNEIAKLQREVQEDDTIMDTLGPRRERLKYDLNQFNELTLEKALIEKDFATLDIMRQIVAPGKGVWGECIALYMDDIRDTTNQLLMNMFNGNLYLDEFVITDKEFRIPYVYNGSQGEDVGIASSSQQAAISMALSLAIIAKMAGNYGVCIFDEADAPMSPANKEMFAEILIKQAKYIGLSQIFVVTHSPEVYSGYDVCRINFPGARIFEDDETIDILKG